MKLGQNVFLIEILRSLEMGHVGTKTRSLGKISQKHYVHNFDQPYTHETLSECLPQ